MRTYSVAILDKDSAPLIVEKLIELKCDLINKINISIDINVTPKDLKTYIDCMEQIKFLIETIGDIQKDFNLKAKEKPLL